MTLTLFPYLGCCEHCCCEHGGAGVSLGSWFHFLCIYTGSGTGASDGSSIFFKFLEGPPYCFLQWLYQSMFPPTVRKGFLFSTSHQHLLSLVFLLMDIRWCLIVVLVCIFLMIGDIEHLFMYLLNICISLEKCVFKSLAHFKVSY